MSKETEPQINIEETVMQMMSEYAKEETLNNAVNAIGEYNEEDYKLFIKACVICKIISDVKSFKSYLPYSPMIMSLMRCFEPINVLQQKDLIIEICRESQSNDKSSVFLEVITRIKTRYRLTEDKKIKDEDGDGELPDVNIYRALHNFKQGKFKKKKTIYGEKCFEDKKYNLKNGWSDMIENKATKEK